MTSKENTIITSKLGHTPTTDNSKKFGSSDMNILKRDLKQVSSTPETCKNENNKKLKDKMDLDDFDIILDDEENLQFRLEKSKTQTNQKSKDKLSRFSTTSNFSLNTAETLSNKMPNFLMNYDDLLQVVSNNRNTIGGSPMLKGEVKSRLLGHHHTTITGYSKNSPISGPESKKSRDKQTEERLNTVISNELRELSIPKVAKKSDNILSFVTAVPQKQNSGVKEIINTTTTTNTNAKEEEEKHAYMKSLTNMEDIKDFYENTEECLKRIAKLKVIPENEIEHLKVDLPFEKEFLNGKKLAVFDLDETLVHCEIKNPSKGQVQIQVKIPNGTITKVNSLTIFMIFKKYFLLFLYFLTIFYVILKSFFIVIEKKTNFLCHWKFFYIFMLFIKNAKNNFYITIFLLTIFLLK